MPIRPPHILFFASLLALAATALAQKPLSVDVLIIGGGASGTTAGIQSARMGAKTLIVEPTEWIGGMLTSAGVSAIDGNHNLPGGLWGEFREKLYDHYGGPEKLETGWVSNTLFEPSVGEQMLRELANIEGLDIWNNAQWLSVDRRANQWTVSVRTGKKTRLILAKVLIDATELGDVMAELGVPYDLGMDSRAYSGEAFAPEVGNNIVQDLTYVLTLKDYGQGADRSIPKPEGYDPEPYRCACDPAGLEGLSCEQMLDYGKLPNGKYMINWPNCGNDIYLNVVENTPEERKVLLEEAKLESLRFLYYLQQELGYKHLGLADNEYPTADHLPMIAYHRESRRLKGMARLSVPHMADPYGQPDPLFRTGVAVGDYPIDHHHKKKPDAPEIDFINIKIPAYNVPAGALLPPSPMGLIVAEKSISVTNIVNGATRLQPVVLGIGQAAGALAALSASLGVPPQAVPIRAWQAALLEAGAYLMPFRDLRPEDPDFAAIQRLGATGILKGTGVPYKWANQQWFYPDRRMGAYQLKLALATYYPSLADYPASGELLTLGVLADMLAAADAAIGPEKIKSDWAAIGLAGRADSGRELKRREIARLLDHYLDPFARHIDHTGNFLE